MSNTDIYKQKPRSVWLQCFSPVLFFGVAVLGFGFLLIGVPVAAAGGCIGIGLLMVAFLYPIAVEDLEFSAKHREFSEACEARQAVSRRAGSIAEL